MAEVLQPPVTAPGDPRQHRLLVGDQRHPCLTTIFVGKLVAKRYDIGLAAREASLKVGNGAVAGGDLELLLGNGLVAIAAASSICRFCSATISLPRLVPCALEPSSGLPGVSLLRHSSTTLMRF
jgi:hypothetical protein